ncbi:DUF4190 domain-containing protein [Microcella daejeonensis]|uniref:DUF4190 domain-containing protein n=1 Tax=Microcella daejeonensis TaxID=2994971 RepID=A0A9E8S7N3_9MICO|nr:DUF4190 domain-containing protein [Microcella daejeonensis]WAB80303.1 DUF4190 domain-containing protein [Microcella daejeonensis]
MSAETPERPVWADAPLRPRRAGRDAAAEHPVTEAAPLAAEAAPAPAVPRPDAAALPLDPGAPEPAPRARARGPVNALAVVSLVLGIMLSPLAALFGHIAVGQIARSRRPGGRDERGMRAAGAAIALGWLSLAALIVGGIAVALALQGGP